MTEFLAGDPMLLKNWQDTSYDDEHKYKEPVCLLNEKRAGALFIIKSHCDEQRETMIENL